MSMGETEYELFGDEGDPADPREGVREAAWFLVEGLLALGMSVRLTAHMIGTGLTRPAVDTGEYRFAYGLSPGFVVRKPVLSIRQQLEIAVMTSAIAGPPWVIMAGSVEGFPGLAAVVWLNAALIIGDPLWVAIAHWSESD